MKSLGYRGTHRYLALIPASHYPKTSGMVLDLQNLDAMWAGPLGLPSVLDGPPEQSSITLVSGEEGTDIAA